MQYSVTIDKWVEFKKMCLISALSNYNFYHKKYWNIQIALESMIRVMYNSIACLRCSVGWACTGKFTEQTVSTQVQTLTAFLSQYVK